MRIFTLLFSFYLLALAVMPCSDKTDCNFLSVEQSSFSTTNHNDHENDKEHCTPFCMCACCGQIITLQNYPAVLLKDLSIVTSQNNYIYTNSFVSEVYLSIWQPPKIS